MPNINNNLRPKVIILSGNGINCEKETALCVELAGGESVIKSINELERDSLIWDQAKAMILPGGFSYGDYLGAGKILSLKLEFILRNQLEKFLIKKKPILGICNGFQVLLRLKILPDPNVFYSFTAGTGGVENIEERPEYGLIINSEQKFCNKWPRLMISPKVSVPWLNNWKSQEILLPVRHGEGRFVCKIQGKFLESYHNIPIDESQKIMRYHPYDHFNGSHSRIAGIASLDGLVVGMMPHPEAALFKIQDPYQNAFHKEKNRSLSNVGIGVRIFRDLIEYLS